MYSRVMPRLWDETIEAHRREVRDAILDTTWGLVTERGLTSVRMSQIAEQTGIGRATLYKYFSDVDAILLAWHERQVAGHLDHLATLRDRADDVGEGLHAVLEAYAFIAHHRRRHAPDLVSLLHSNEHVDRAHQRLHALVRDLLGEAAAVGHVRGDVRPDELATYCLHALTGAGELSSEDAVRRLVDVTLVALRPWAGPES